MKSKTISIIIGSLVILIGGTYIALQSGEIIEPQDITQIEFQANDISVKRENVEITTSTDQFGNTIKSGIRVPIRYNFPIATSMGYIVQEVEEYVSMNFDGYNMCRESKTKNQCLKELRDDIEQTLKARQENIARELEELKRSQFRNEITEEDL